jgi:hypothetical protein
MAKRITTRFAGFCRKCSKPISQGSEAYWTKTNGKSEMWHIECPEGDAPSDNSTEKYTFPWEGNFDTSEDGIPRYNVDFSELKSDYMKAVNGDTSPTNSYRVANRDRLAKLVENWTKKGTFYGATSEQMLEWLSKGFSVEMLENIESLVQLKPRRRIRQWEEGDELLVDLALAGEEAPFIQWEKRESKPGLSVVMDCTFNATVDAKIIAEYGRWVARALYTLEAMGFDTSVSYRMITDGSVITGPMANKKTCAEIRVKKENEASDFASFSSLFSPGGFRHIGFLTVVKMAQYFKGNVATGLGRAMPHGDWAVKWDAENRVMRFHHPGSPTHFPSSLMTEMFSGKLDKLTT